MTSGYRVGAAEHFLREIGIVAKPFLVGAILAEDFDETHVVGRDDDVAARVS